MASSLVQPASGSRHKISFADITAPIAPEQFLSRFWTRQAVHLVQEGRTFDRQFNWDAVNAVLNSDDLVFPKVKVSRHDDGVPSDEFTREVGDHRIVDSHAVLNLFHDGASFGITRADTHWPPLRSVVDCLYDALLESVHANVYCSPPNTQGFQCHFDLHEVFVLQVEGAKRWRVFRPTIDSPTQSWRAEDRPSASTEPYLDVELRKGDVLYVPRGHWHYAVAQDSISLHVTAGVTCRKGTTFLDWLVGELRDDAAWRKNAPLMNDAISGGAFRTPTAVAEWAVELKASLIEKLSEPDLFERFCKDTLAELPVTRTVEMPIRLGPGLPLDTLIFERPMGRRHFFRSDRDSAIAVTVGSVEIQLEGIHPGLIKRIFDAESFTVDDIRSWHPEVALDEIAELLSELVRSGLLVARLNSAASTV